ncbi:CHAT domain-containing tetratricopeptide repeat protein [Sodalinema gerasimenkoae]|uniref:CHAT domain-containing tetratricopeptide repeat protein n=1 Tax=Sodalinema gerasimenkoae TaxID=2862348 RepID=UPI00135C9CB6|nr:CHAT domain-containing protein [Sodalinema gerasimenkoae]
MNVKGGVRQLDVMTKLVVLHLIGDLETRGFEVILEVGEVGSRPQLRVKGTLPASPELGERVRSHWQDHYGTFTRSQTARIKPKLMGMGHAMDACKTSAAQLGQAFQQWLTSEGFQAIDRRLREVLSLEDEIRLAIASESEVVRQLPWHLWEFYRRYGKTELMFSPVTGMRPPATPGQGLGRLRILAILGSDEGIDVESDRRFLEGLPGAEVTFLVAPSRQMVSDRLWEESWDILFFAGHSETQGQRGCLYLNAEEQLSLDELRYGLSKAIQRGLRLAIFNSCDGLGLTTALDDCAIPQMIVMREAVPDRVAQMFLKQFLGLLSRGVPFHLAVREARERLQGIEDRFPCASWLPVIVQHPDAIAPQWRLESKEFGDWRRWLVQGVQRVGMGWLVGGMAIALTLWGRGWLGGWLHQQGITLYGVHRYDQAEDLWNLTLLVDPGRRTTLYMLGYLHEQVGDDEVALQWYGAAGRRGLPQAYRRQAQMMIRQGEEIDFAVTLAEKGLSVLIDQGSLGQEEMRTTLAWGLWQQGQRGQAYRHLDAVLESSRQVPLAYCLYGAMLTEEGLEEAAAPFWQSCLDTTDVRHRDEGYWRNLARVSLKP